MEDNGELTGLAIPTEIIVEILSRLTVKSLCRFRCVSKPWRSLISSTKFIALHDKKALEDKHVFLERRRVIFTAPVSSFVSSLHSLDLDEFLTHADHHDSLVTATKLDFVHQEISADNFWDPYMYIYACNNLLLLKINIKLIYLVNPATREIRKVPEIPAWWMYKIHTQFTSQLSIGGFGFDYSTNEYKVVMGNLVRQNGIAGVQFSVYKLETDSWRNIERLFPYKPLSVPGFFLNGAVHWLGYSTVEAFSILSFRLAEEEAREIQLPPRFIEVRSPAARLGVFRDCLCITLHNEFWVMKEYGVSESWTRIKISKLFNYLAISDFSTKSHDLVVRHKSLRHKSLAMYDFEEDSCEDLPIRDIPEVGEYVGTYVEGLFPLNRFQYERRKK